MDCREHDLRGFRSNKKRSTKLRQSIVTTYSSAWCPAYTTVFKWRHFVIRCAENPLRPACALRGVIPLSKVPGASRKGLPTDEGTWASHRGPRRKTRKRIFVNQHADGREHPKHHEWYTLIQTKYYLESASKLRRRGSCTPNRTGTIEFKYFG